MKCLLLLFVAIAVSTASVIINPTRSYQEGDKYFYFASDDGVDYLVDADEPVDLAFINYYTSDLENYEFLLFTRNNPRTADSLIFGHINSITSSNFNSSKVTVFIAHGWKGDESNNMNRMLRDAFLQNGDVNVIVFDWGELAKRNYPTAKAGVAAVGRGLGQFVTWFVASGFSDYSKIHLVGFSLGGHLVGNAGRETKGKIARITALDPAGPLWTWDSRRINPDDGLYVEVIHTNTAFLGYTNPCGDADYYPNGGSSMPGCFLHACSHSRAYEYMASSIRTNHLLANQCDTYRDARRNRCRGALSPMGNSELSKPIHGIFRVNTLRHHPY